MCKAQEFKEAMSRYHTIPLYKHSRIVLSTHSVTLQLLSVFYLIMHHSYSKFISIEAVFVFIASYLCTDFINGCIHMHMDNNHHYSGRLGPLIAHFHLHHKKVSYTKKHILHVWLDETGDKVWLAGYLLIIFIMQKYIQMPFKWEFFLVSFGILSSFAELSHYWCHTPSRTNRFIQLLQNKGILLNMKRHRVHHTQDNRDYAFLCGISDVVINLIARKYYSGYKNEADLHARAYQSAE